MTGDPYTDSGSAVCTRCKESGKENPFAVPAPLDAFGAGLMEEHFIEEHGDPRRPAAMLRFRPVDEDEDAW